VTAIVAALLHDTIEDTPTTREMLEERFGPEVAGIVSELSDDMSLPKEERRQARLSAAPHKSPRSKMVKAADVVSNLSAIVNSPPAGWNYARMEGYLKSCRDLLDAIDGGHPDLAPVAADVVEATEAAISDRKSAGGQSPVAPTAELDAAVGQPVHLVYLANTEHEPMDETVLDRLCARVSETFPSATLQGAEAVYEGRRRPIFMIRLRTDETAAVVALAQQLCVDFRQRFVGVEVAGRYIRVYADDTA
jgi:uncharacterized protein (UPF0147 family)